MYRIVWGPFWWWILHSKTFSLKIYEYYKDADGKSYWNTTNKMRFLLFFENVCTNLPCEICVEHYKAYSAKDHISNHMSTVDEVIEYVFDFHNHVNRSNGKGDFSWNKFVEMYDTVRNR